MLVDLELKAIADRYGALTPQIALGYRAGVCAREFFDGLDQVSARVHDDDATAFALGHLLRRSNALAPLTVHGWGRQEFAFYDDRIQTLLRLRARPEVTRLPPCLREAAATTTS